MPRLFSSGLCCVDSRLAPRRPVGGRWPVVSVALAAVLSSCAASESPPPKEWVSIWAGPEAPEASPYWWPVSDEVSPAALRAALLDPEANETRYREAVRAGVERSSPPDSDTRFVVYVHGSLDPDLMPLWAAYQRLWIRARPGSYFWDPGRPARELRDGLHGAGLSIEGAEAVVAQSQEANREVESLNREAAPRRQRFHTVLRRAQWSLGKTGALRALYLGDDALLALASFTREEEVRQLRAAWETSYRDEAGLRAIESLKARLTAADWEQFKEYLLEEVVPGLSYLDVEERVPEARPFEVLIRLLAALGLLVGTLIALAHLRVRRARAASR